MSIYMCVGIVKVLSCSSFCWLSLVIHGNLYMEDGRGNVGGAWVFVQII